MKEGIFQRKSFPWKKCLAYIERNRNNRRIHYEKKNLDILCPVFRVPGDDKIFSEKYRLYSSPILKCAPPGAQQQRLPHL